MPEWLEQLLALQNIDLTIAECDEQLEMLPKQKAEAASALQAQQNLVDEGKKNLNSLETKRKAVENEISATRETKKNFQTKSALIKNNDEYKAALLQIEMCDKLIADKEEEQLNIMLEIENAQADYKAIQTNFNTKKAEIEAQAKEFDKQIADCQAKRANILSTRDAAASNLEPPLLARYNRLRSAKNVPRTRPVVVPITSAKSCGKCHMAVTKQEELDARKGKLVLCGNCGAIIYSE